MILVFIFLSSDTWADAVSGHPCKNAHGAKPQTSVPVGFSFCVNIETLCSFKKTPAFPPTHQPFGLDSVALHP